MPQSDTKNLVILDPAESALVMQALRHEAKRQQYLAGDFILHKQHEKACEAIRLEALAEYLAHKFDMSAP